MSPTADVAVLERVRGLQEKVRQVEGARPAGRPLPTLPALGPLLPGGSLRAGGVYAVEGSLTLAAALAAGASGQGSWCAVVGLPSLGAEAAVGLGVDLARTILLPDPGAVWLPATQALVDVLAVVVLRPPARPTEREAARLAARLRERGCALVVVGDWPRCDVRLSVERAGWVGLGDGHGHLVGRRATVVAAPRTGRPSRTELWLPGPDQRVAPVEDPAVAPVAAPVAGEQPLRPASVGLAS